MERECVRSFGDLDEDGIVRTLMRVVLRQLYPQPSSLDTDGGVTLGVESDRSAQDFGGNLVLLERDAGVIERVFGQIA